MWQTRGARLSLGPFFVIFGVITLVSDVRHGDWLVPIFLAFLVAAGVDKTIKGLRMPRRPPREPSQPL